MIKLHKLHVIRFTIDIGHITSRKKEFEKHQ